MKHELLALVADPVANVRIWLAQALKDQIESGGCFADDEMFAEAVLTL